MQGRGSVVYGLFSHQYICLTSSKRLTRQLANVLGAKWVKGCLYMSVEGGLILVSQSLNESARMHTCTRKTSLTR